MPRLNSCPEDRGQLDFVGISRHQTNKVDPDTGTKIIEHHYWRQCSTCKKFVEATDYGTVILVTGMEPDKKLFKVPKDD